MFVVLGVGRFGDDELQPIREGAVVVLGAGAVSPWSACGVAQGDRQVRADKEGATWARADHADRGKRPRVARGVLHERSPPVNLCEAPPCTRQLDQFEADRNPARSLIARMIDHRHH